MKRLGFWLWLRLAPAGRRTWRQVRCQLCKYPACGPWCER